MSLKKDDSLYQSMIYQLEQDGFHAAAHYLGEVTNTRRAPPSSQIYKSSLRDIYDVKASTAVADSKTIDTTSSYLDQDFIDFTNNLHSGRPNNVKFNFACKSTSEISAVKISRDAHAFAVAYEDRSVAIFKTETAKSAGNIYATRPPHELVKEKIVLKIGKGESSHSGSITGIDFHPFVSACASTDKSGSIKIWKYDFSTRQNEASFYSSIDDMNINCCKFDPSGSQILLGGSDHHLRLHDIAKKKSFKFSETDHKSEITALDCRVGNGSSYTIATGDKLGTLCLWDSRTAKKTFSGQILDSAFNRITFSNGGNYLMASSRNRVAVYDVRNLSNKLYSLVDVNTGSAGATFSEKDSMIAFVDDEKSVLFRFNVLSKQFDYNQLRLENDSIFCCDASVNPGYIVTGGAGGVVKLFKSLSE